MIVSYVEVRIFPGDGTFRRMRAVDVDVVDSTDAEQTAKPLALVADAWESTAGLLDSRAEVSP